MAVSNTPVLRSPDWGSPVQNTTDWIDVIDTSERSSQVYNAVKIDKLNADERIDFSIRMLKKFGTEEFETLHKRLVLSKEERVFLKGIIKDVSQNILQNTVLMEKIENLSEEELTRFSNATELGNSTRAFLRDKYPDVQFYKYLNKVGNCKSVLVMETKGQKYVVRALDAESAKDYLSKYEELKEKQHRPNINVVENGEEWIMLSEFMGSETIDWSNKGHLILLANLINEGFVTEKDAIDINEGNLVVNNGKLFYIDHDLECMGYETEEEAIADSKDEVIYQIKKQKFPDEGDLIKTFEECFKTDS